MAHSRSTCAATQHEIFFSCKREKSHHGLYYWQKLRGWNDDDDDGVWSWEERGNSGSGKGKRRSFPELNGIHIYIKNEILQKVIKIMWENYHSTHITCTQYHYIYLYKHHHHHLHHQPERAKIPSKYCNNTNNSKESREHNQYLLSVTFSLYCEITQAHKETLSMVWFSYVVHLSIDRFYLPFT